MATVEVPLGYLVNKIEVVVFGGKVIIFYLML